MWVPKEHVQNRDGELIGVVPVPQITDDIGDVTQRAPERIHTRVVEQIVDLAVPLILEKFVEIIQFVPLERIKDQSIEHIKVVPVPQIKKDIVQNLVGEQIVDVPMPQIVEKLGVAVQPAQSERIRDQSMEQISVVSQTTEKVSYCIRIGSWRCQCP